jgi:hypothetical protein
VVVSKLAQSLLEPELVRDPICAACHEHPDLWLIYLI